MTDTRRMTVYGIPQSKGSTRSFVNGGRVVTTSTNKNLAAWSALVADAAQRAALGEPLLAGPVVAWVTFYLPKPKSARRSDIYPAKKPDVDKLLRAALDPLIGRWFKDDAQVVSVRMSKVYGDPPRIEITVAAMEGAD